MPLLDSMKKKTPLCSCTDSEDVVCGLEMFQVEDTWICAACDMISLEEIAARKEQPSES